MLTKAHEPDILDQDHLVILLRKQFLRWTRGSCSSPGRPRRTSGPRDPESLADLRDPGLHRRPRRISRQPAEYGPDQIGGETAGVGASSSSSGQVVVTPNPPLPKTIQGFALMEFVAILKYPSRKGACSARWFGSKTGDRSLGRDPGQEFHWIKLPGEGDRTPRTLTAKI